MNPTPQDAMTRAFDGRRCLVTGGAGFIGSNLTRALAAAGARVIVLDNFSTGRREHLPSHSAITIVEDDLRTMAGLEKLAADAEIVFHLAAQVGNVKSIEDAVGDASSNVMGTVRLLQACRGHARLSRIVYASSSAIFGEARFDVVAEDHPVSPASFYALSKLTSERYARLAHDLWGVPTVGLRFFNVFGLPMERNEYTGVISIFFDRLSAGRPLTIYGDGRQIRDFVAVDDVVQGLMLAGAGGPAGGVFNIGSGTATSILDLARVAMAVAGREVEIEHAPARAGEVQRSLADIRRARETLGYQPRVTLEAGLQTLWRRLVAEASANGV